MAAVSTPTTNLSSTLPSPAANSGGSDSTALTAILSFLALICIPILIYAFFFAIRCPPNPFEWNRRRSGRLAGELADKTGHVELVYSVVEYKKETNETNHGAGECPVCLSMYTDGEEVRQLKVCKHMFHVACIDMWLSSHPSCPVCRSSIGGVKRSNRLVIDGDDDLRQGLPDSASLVWILFFDYIFLFLFPYFGNNLCPFF